jgi:hypothetical protein
MLIEARWVPESVWSGRVMSLLDNAARQSLRHSPFALAWRIVLAILGAVPSRFFPITSVSDFKVPITLVGTFFFVVHPILSLYLETSTLNVKLVLQTNRMQSKPSVRLEGLHVVI